MTCLSSLNLDLLSVVLGFMAGAIFAALFA